MHYGACTHAKSDIFSPLVCSVHNIMAMASLIHNWFIIAYCCMVLIIATIRMHNHYTTNTIAKQVLVPHVVYMCTRSASLKAAAVSRPSAQWNAQ